MAAADQKTARIAYRENFYLGRIILKRFLGFSGFISIIYHLHGESGPSQVCTNGTHKFPMASSIRIGHVYFLQKTKEQK